MTELTANQVRVRRPQRFASTAIVTVIANTRRLLSFRLRRLRLVCGTRSVSRWPNWQIPPLRVGGIGRSG